MSETNTQIATTNDEAQKAMLAAGSGVPVGGKAPPPPPPGRAYIGARNAWTSDETAQKLDAAGVENDSFYVSDAAGILSPKPFQIHVLSLSRYMGFFDKVGRTVDIVIPSDSRDENAALWDDGARPLVLGLAAVVLPQPDDEPSSFLLATFTFKSAAVKAFEKAASLGQPGGAAFDKTAWAKRSAQHAATAGLWPQFRYRATIWGESGDVFKTYAQIEPTPAKDVPAIEKLCGPDFGRVIAPVHHAFGQRVSKWEQFAQLSDDEKKTAQVPF